MTGVDLQRLQQKRKQVLIVGIAIGVVLLATSDSNWRIAWPNVHRSIQWSGLLLILICILGRTWATLYIGGQSSASLVTKGRTPWCATHSISSRCSARPASAHCPAAW